MPAAKFRLIDLWTHRELILRFTLRDVELRHKGSHLGLVWSVVNPLLLLLLYVFVFGYVFGGKFNIMPDETPMDYALAVFVGLTVFHFVAEVMAVAPLVIISNPNFVKKVVFPLEILPIASVASAAFHGTVTMILSLAGVAFFGTGIDTTWGWLPLILFPVLLGGMGASWLLSAIGTFFRDIVQMTQFLSMALLFSSAVFYSAHKIPPTAWAFMKYNPMIHAEELTRGVVVWHQAPNLGSLLYLNLWGVTLFFCGFAVFRGLRGAFADVL